MAHDFKLIVPPCTVRFFENGERCTDAVDGDELLIRHPTLAGEAIALGQAALRLTQPDLAGFTWNDHDAFVRGTDAHGGAVLSEMGPRGYERRSLSDYDSHLYAVVHYEVSDVSRETALAFDRACEGIRYGWLEYPEFVIDGITDARFDGGWGDALICSAHLTMVTMGLGFFPDRQVQAIAPCHRSMWVNARHD